MAKRALISLSVSVILAFVLVIGVAQTIVLISPATEVSIVSDSVVTVEPVTALGSSLYSGRAALPEFPSDLSAYDLESLIVDIYQTTVDSVVSIVTPDGEGSGWAWDDQGHIVTNYHVVLCATCNDGSTHTNITVNFADGYDTSATVVGVDPSGDLAVLKTDIILEPLPLGNSSEILPGQLALAVGSPFGQEFSITQGIISAVGRLLPSGFSTYSIAAVIQTDAPLNPGNSGGPLLDSNGRVIGVNTQIAATTNQNSGVGYAVPIDLIKRVVPVLVQGETYEYSLLGVGIGPLNSTYREATGIPNNVQGALITRVYDFSPASRGDLMGGDIVTELLIPSDTQSGTYNSFELRNSDEFISSLNLYTSPGDDVLLKVYRDGQYIDLPVELTNR